MADNETVLTIVVPVHGVAGYLHQCLDSLRAGLTEDESAAVEIIAVDDASPDGCGGLLDAYAGRHGGMRVVHLPFNVGLGLARNAGLAEARGAYVWFVDSDDWLPAGSVRAVLQRLRGGPDVLLVDHLRVHEDGRAEPDASSHLLRDVPGSTRLADRPQLLRVQHTAWNRVVSRALLERIGLRFHPGWYEDVPFSNPVLIAAERIDVLDRVCYHYRQGRQGAITATRSDRHFEAFEQYERLQDWVRARDPEPWLLADLFRLMISHYLVVTGNDSRLPARHRRAFFRRAAAHYRRYRPAAGAGDGGLKHRLLRWDNYPLYAALRQAHRIAARARSRTAAAPLPATALAPLSATASAPTAAPLPVADPQWSPQVRPDLAFGSQTAQGEPIR